MLLQVAVFLKAELYSILYKYIYVTVCVCVCVCARACAHTHAPGFCCHAGAFRCNEQELCLVAVCGLLTIVASLVAEHGP